MECQHELDICSTALLNIELQSLLKSGLANKQLSAPVVNALSDHLHHRTNTSGHHTNNNGHHDDDDDGTRLTTLTNRVGTRTVLEMALAQAETISQRVKCTALLELERV